MSLIKQVREQLISVQFAEDDLDTKQGFTYVKWAKAWDVLTRLYPDSDWKELPVQYLEDGTATVHVEVTIAEGEESVTRRMSLPVLNGNKPISKPNSHQINTAYMRCMVKCLAAKFGLGLYIYEGDESPYSEDDELQDILDTYVHIAEDEVQEKFWKACGQSETKDIRLVDKKKLRPAVKWLKEQVEKAA